MNRKLAGFGFYLSLLAVVILAAEPPKPASSSNILLVAVLNGSGSIPGELRPAVGKWLVSHFNYLLAPHWLMPTAGTSTVSAVYQEAATVYAPQTYSWVHDVAVQSDIQNYEDMLLHINQDFSVVPRATRANLDQFDNFEQRYWQASGAGSIGVAVNGAFLQSRTG